MNNIKKKITIGLLTILFIPSTVFTAGKLPENASNKKINVYINNVEKNIPTDMGKVFLDENTNRVMVPIRYISEEMGAYINFYREEATKKNGILIGGINEFLIKLEIGSKNVNILYNNKENKEKTIDSPAILYDERTYVPIRFISETMGLEVKWEDGKVLITGELKKENKDNVGNINEKLKITENSNVK